MCGEMIILRFFNFSNTSLKVILCAAAVVLLAGCHNKDADKNNDETSPSDIEIISDSDYYEYLENYIDTGSMSFEEIGRTLKELSISVDDKTLEKAENSWNSMDPDEMDSLNKIGFVLSYVGAGSYDSNAKTFTPSSDKVYCFDLENGADDKVIEGFFRGINSISRGEFEITGVKLQSISDKDKEDGVYKRNIKFKLNGKSCSYDAEIYYDWFDTNLIKYINEMLKKQKISNRLYYMEENLTCEVFYCSKKWAEDFAAKTGCELRTEDM